MLQINNKYSEELAQECLEWVKEITGEEFSTSGEMDNFYEGKEVSSLKMVNKVKAGSVKKINQSTMAFKCMENINAFLDVARQLGVPAQETFQTVDLWERQNLNSVVICLQSLGRKVGAGNYGLPGIGPKEADKNVRQFSEEQMRAGQGVISLQYGSNKGANQSGINFGNTRHIPKMKDIENFTCTLAALSPQRWCTPAALEVATCRFDCAARPRHDTTRQESVSRAAVAPRTPAGNYGLPGIGPKEADKNVRQFSEEQMRAGQGVISLQYGSNKGANQSGINFGNTRHM
ncbi:hypothetical protein B566_EDAN007079 [Ephemera danica]|nr:hypothetical protein B566_EDAN007079 [Ephemera danica]